MSLTLNLSSDSSVLQAKFSPPIILDRDGEIGLLSLIFWNSIPNVNSTNQNFYYKVGNEEFKIVIPTGCYEIEDIQDHLRDHLRKQHQKTHLTDEETLIIGEHPIILFGNRQTLKSEIICRYEVDFSKPNNIAKLLGFSERIIPSFQRAESDRNVDILKVEVIRVLCNLAESSFVNNTPMHVVYQFFPEVPPGFKVVEIPHNLIYHNLNSREISEVEIRLVDQDNNLLDLRGEKVFLRLHVRTNANLIREQ